ncbi:MAG: class I SAM-dependent methyltransferase [Clostridiales Family XIII bacterium]|nr:class I SAM-dependent methyltransferase [Clostridiales Family XIII bacterium]
MKREPDRDKPLINWDVIQQMMFRRMPPPPRSPEGGGEGADGMPGRGIGGWDGQADNYNRMIHMEARFTLNQVDCFDTSPTDTVLDIGCGPGRITMPMAERAASVTALDASPKMLDHVRDNCAARGITNVDTLLCDWEDEESAAKIEQHDIVICSRTVALSDIERIAALARKWVALVIWANGAPPIPAILGKLFEGTQEDGDARPSPPFPPMDRRFGNNVFYNLIYDHGFDPNVKLVEDGFERVFASREEAESELLKLSPDVSMNKIDRFRSNLASYLTERPDGSVYFLAPTRSIVYWFSPERKIYD